MSSIVTSNFRVQNAKNFLDDIKSYDYYITIGKVDEWVDKSLLPSNTREAQIYNWNSMIGGKKVLNNRVSLVIPRINWTANTVYTMYDDNVDDLDSSQFYVITDDANVYKCLYNNNDGLSTVKPTGTNISSIVLSDGYIWKYMYSISIEEANIFNTTAFIPVKTLHEDDGSKQWEVQNNAVDGSIEVINVLNGGQGYQAIPEIVIKGDGEDAAAVATIEDGRITKIQMTNIGRGYKYATVEIIGDCEREASVKAIISPEGGHGSNPSNELFGRRVMLNAVLSGDEDGQLTITNDFRIITVLRDPTVTGNPEHNEEFVMPSIFNELTKINFSSGYTGIFELDDVVTGLTSGATGKIANFDELNGVISLCNVVGDFSIDETIETTKGGMSTIGSITEPDFIKYSGDIIYVDYRNPISRAEDQEENIRITLEF